MCAYSITLNIILACMQMWISLHKLKHFEKTYPVTDEHGATTSIFSLSYF